MIGFLRRQARPAGLVAAAVMIAACSGGGAPSFPTGSGAPSSAGPAATNPSAARSTASSASAAAPPSTSPSTGATTMPEAPFRLTSAAFDDGDPIPRRHTCDGEDVSPPLAWSGVPEGAGALALIVDDPDASGFIHWVAFDIAPGTTGLAEGASTAPGAPAQARNDFGRVGWGGPCPPSGTHRYRFRLVAIDGPLGLSGTPAGRSVAAAVADRAIGTATLTGTYARG